MGIFINVEELAEYLGLQESTIYAWVHCRQLPYYKIGRLVKFKKSDIDEWLKGHKVEKRVI